MNANASFIVRLGGNAEPLYVGKRLVDVIIHKSAELLPYALASRRLCHAKRLEDDGTGAKRRGERKDDEHMIKFIRLVTVKMAGRGGSYNKLTGNCRQTGQQCPTLKAARLHQRRQTRP